MPLSAEVQNWANGMRAQGVSEDDLKTMLGVLEKNDKAQAYVKDSVLAQADYTRQVQAAKAQEAEAQKKLQEAQAVIEANTNWHQTAEAERQAAVKAREAAEVRLAQTRARLESLKAQGYLDDAQLAGLDTAVTATTTTATTTTAAGTPTGGNQPKYLTEQQAGVYGLNISKLSARLGRMAREHERLFAGTDKVDFDGERIIEHVDKNGGKLEDAWEAVYGVSARREEIRKADTEKEIARRTDEEVRKRISAEIQAGRPVIPAPSQSNIMRMKPIPDPQQGKSPAQKRFERVQRAVAELETKRVGAATTD